MPYLTASACHAARRPRAPRNAAIGLFRTYVPPDCSSVSPAGPDGGGAELLCVSTSPPPGEPGPDSAASSSSGPELLYGLFPPVVVADGAADPARRPPRRWRVPSVPVLGALIAVVLMSGVVVAVDHSHCARSEEHTSEFQTRFDLI